MKVLTDEVIASFKDAARTLTGPKRRAFQAQVTLDYLIERCWGILENHWNGTLLNSVHTVVEWARTMTWNGVQPVVTLIEKTYDKGVRIAKAAFKAVESRLQRDTILPKYEILIQPQSI